MTFIIKNRTIRPWQVPLYKLAEDMLKVLYGLIGERTDFRFTKCAFIGTFRVKENPTHSFDIAFKEMVEKEGLI